MNKATFVGLIFLAFLLIPSVSGSIVFRIQGFRIKAEDKLGLNFSRAMLLYLPWVILSFVIVFVWVGSMGFENPRYNIDYMTVAKAIFTDSVKFKVDRVYIWARYYFAFLFIFFLALALFSIYFRLKMGKRYKVSVPPSESVSVRPPAIVTKSNEIFEVRYLQALGLWSFLNELFNIQVIHKKIVPRLIVSMMDDAEYAYSGYLDSHIDYGPHTGIVLKKVKLLKYDLGKSDVPKSDPGYQSIDVFRVTDNDDLLFLSDSAVKSIKIKFEIEAEKFYQNINEVFEVTDDIEVSKDMEREVLDSLAKDN